MYKIFKKRIIKKKKTTPFKKTNIIQFVKFSKTFFQSPEFDIYNSTSFSSKGEGNLVTVVVGSLTAWISVVTINRLAQAKLLF